MKRLLLLFCLFPLFSKAQDVEFEKKDGVVLTYKLTKLREDVKKDTYLLVVKAINKNDYPVFYQGPANNVNPFLASVTVRNSDDNINLTANPSRLTADNRKLYYLDKGSEISEEKEIKVLKGQLPIITGKFWSDVKNILEFK